MVFNTHRGYEVKWLVASEVSRVFVVHLHPFRLLDLQSGQGAVLGSIHWPPIAWRFRSKRGPIHQGTAASWDLESLHFHFDHVTDWFDRIRRAYNRLISQCLKSIGRLAFHLLWLIHIVSWTHPLTWLILCIRVVHLLRNWMTLRLHMYEPMDLEFM